MRKPVGAALAVTALIAVLHAQDAECDENPMEQGENPE